MLLDSTYVNKAWILIRVRGDGEISYFDTSLHKPYNILVGDTWTAETSQDTCHLHALNIYTVGSDIELLDVQRVMK